MKPKLEPRYFPNVRQFLRSMAKKNRELSGERYTFYGSNFAVRGPWNAIEFSDKAEEEDAEEAIKKAVQAEENGEIRCYAVRLRPTNNPNIARFLEEPRNSRPVPTLRPIRSESVVCRKGDLPSLGPKESKNIGEFLPDNGFKEFTECQLRGYGYQGPIEDAIKSLAGMYQTWHKKEPGRLVHIAARSDDGQMIGTLSYLVREEEESRSIGLYGLALIPERPQRELAQRMIEWGVQRAKEEYAVLRKGPPPLLVALCDSNQRNERLFRLMGFRQAELRPIYGEQASGDFEAELGRLRWPRRRPYRST